MFIVMVMDDDEQLDVIVGPFDSQNDAQEWADAHVKTVNIVMQLMTVHEWSTH